MSKLEAQEQTDKEQHSQWLEWRRKGLGASDAASVLGLSPWKSPLALYQEKRGESKPEDIESEGMEIGTCLEPSLATLYGKRTGRRILRMQVKVTHPKHRFLRATLDGIDFEGNIVEFKVSSAKGWGEPGTEEIPTYYRLQAVHQMLVSNKDRVIFGVLYQGRQFRLYEIPRYPDEIERLREALLDFWGMVRKGTPPDPTASDGKLMAVLNANAPPVELSPSVADLWRRYEQTKALIEEQKQFLNVYKDDLEKALGASNMGKLPDGRYIRRAYISVRETVVNRKAFSFSKLEILKEKGGNSNG